MQFNPQFLWCSFAGHPSSPVTSHRFVCTHAELQGHYSPSPLKTWKQGSQYLQRRPLSLWQCVVLHRHCPLSKQDYIDEQRQACLLPVSRYFGGDSLSARTGNFGDEMQLSGIWGDQNKNSFCFCTPSFEITAAFQVAVGRWPIISSYELSVLLFLFIMFSILLS